MPPKNKTNIPHHHDPNAQSATAPAKNTQAIINLKIFNIICNAINKVQISVNLHSKSTSI